MKKITPEILVTGGTGYIGSHTVVELIQAGYTPVIVDNLANSSIEVLDRIETITGVKPVFYKLDVTDRPALERVFEAHNFEVVIHFAGLKAVGESVTQPLSYYRNNIVSSLSLLETMDQFGVKQLVFSSSATVYGTSPSPCSETDPTGIGITNPYGQTKFMIEQIIKDYCLANPDFQAMVLRYYNPVGAHPSGLIGEEPSGIPNNLLPYVAQVATGKLPTLKVFGADYDTPDGTGVRDYIHVVDLAIGHLQALKSMSKGFTAVNLGTGHGTSVLEIIKAFEKVSGQVIPFQVVARRPGDLDQAYANCDKALQLLHWQATRTIDDACLDDWRWQTSKSNKH